MRISDWSSDVCSSDLTTAVAKGDLSRKITVDAQGEILQLKDTVNTMVDQLNGFAAEATRVAREVGTERSEERRGGKECVSTCRSRWSTDSHIIKNLTH